MSNIHGFRDLDDREPNRGNPRASPLLMMNELNSSENARKESFCIFLKNIICPNSSWKSIVVWIAILNIIIYISTISFGIAISDPSHRTLLAPTTDTLDKFGMLVRFLINIFRFQIN
jgi:hypothetical protein